ncbi:MAG: ABC transporter ATP-binding protein [Acidaminococcales bacterium]|nr:ABC transporter ATP-binding protein [Acidaminococcales bacterium]
MAQVKIEHVSKKFGEVTAVNDFSVTISDGEFVSILGPSGCGKTTVLRMIAGFERASGGDIYLGDKLVSSAGSRVFLPPEKRGIGMVFQSYAVWPHMTVFDNVAYPLKIQKKSKEEIRRRTEEVIELVHLAPYISRYPHQLSGGQQQRVALGRALAGKPALLLLDEPLSNLDAKLRESMRFEIKSLQEKTGVTVIYVTHDQAEAMAMSDRIVVMHGGVIQQIDRPIMVYEKPANKVVADFIGLVNFIGATVEGNMAQIHGLRYEISNEAGIAGKALAAARPEHIKIGKAARPDALAGRLLHKVYLGDSVDYRVQIGGDEIRIINKATHFEEFALGDEVYVNFKKLMVFKAE